MTHEEFARRVTSMQGALYRVSSSVLPQLCDREDAVQGCILKAWRKLGSLRDESKLEGWVMRILLNECYTLLARRKRELPTDNLPEREAPPDADPDLYRFFTGLPDKLRTPMTLYYVEGYAVQEIAAALRIPAGTVKSRLSRGRALMKQDEQLKEAQEL